MTREEQICSQSVRYTKETHSPSSVSEFQAAMNIAVVKAFTAGAKWADETILQEVIKWLDNNFFTGEIEGYYSDVPEHIVQSKFDCKEEMLLLFKEHFNIE